MRRTALGRRVGHVTSRVPMGCPACRSAPPLVVLWPEDPTPLSFCVACGRAAAGTTRVRFAQLDRGPT